jgi:hypothetical protein
MARPLDVAACYFRLSRNPRDEAPAMRREAARLAGVAGRLPEIDRMIERSKVNFTPAVPDDPDRTCCAWCGSADSRLSAEDGFGRDAYCADTAGCVARHGARVAPWPVPAHLAALRNTAEAARAELAAMTEAASMYASDCGRITDETLMLAVPALSLPPAVPARSLRPVTPKRSDRREHPEPDEGPVVLQWLE